MLGLFKGVNWWDDPETKKDDAWKNQYLLNIQSNLIEPLSKMITMATLERANWRGNSNRRLGKNLADLISSLQDAKALAEQINNDVISGN